MNMSMNPKHIPLQPKPDDRITIWKERFLAAADSYVRMIMNREYKGDNPAMAKAYAPLRASILFISLVSAIILIFGIAVPVESAAIAKGNVTVLNKRKTVQHLEGGIIKAILVKDGDSITKGQPLIELSDVTPKANRSMVQADLWLERAAEARLNALRENKDTITFPDELVQVAQHNTDIARTMQAQQELFTTQREAQIGKLQTLQQRIAESEEEIKGLKAQISSAEGQLVYINEEIKTVKTLLKDGLATKPRLLALQRSAEELKGNRGQNIAMIAKVQQNMTESKMHILNQQNEFASQIAEELKEVRSKINDHTERLSAASDVMNRTIVIAPSEGIVTGLKYHTVGGVIEPGAAIMDIVPQNEELVLEVKIRPVDIDVVKPGLESRVVFSAYKSRRMPLFTGTVTQVSADAFTEKQGLGEESYYTARVNVDTQQMKALETPIVLYPGMPADVYIKTGSRSFISYLMAPITDSMDHAFKEE
jgi:HlyD family secretion protein